MLQIIETHDIRRQTIEPYFRKLNVLFEAMDQAYVSIANQYGFDCKGCEDSCCQTLFYHHTLVEYLYLKEGFDGISDEQKKMVVQRAQQATQQMATQVEGSNKIRIMCPLNEKDLCSLYPYRPMICRLHGISHELHRNELNVLKGRGWDYIFAPH